MIEFLLLQRILRSTCAILSCMCCFVLAMLMSEGCLLLFVQIRVDSCWFIIKL